MSASEQQKSGESAGLPCGLSIKTLLGSDAYVGQSVEINGWVRTRRDSKAGISFIALTDGSCLATLQCVVPADLPNYETEVLKITTGCSICVSGEVVPSQGKGQSVELQVKALTVWGWVDNPDTYPMAAKRHTMEHLREHAHLRVRTNVMGAISRVRHAVSQAIHGYFSDLGFLWLSTPIITACDAEGAGELFRVTTLDMDRPPQNDLGRVDDKQDFFHKPAYLTCSGQMNAEACAMGLGKVYTFGPTFRAEDSNTTRHLAEFWMVEPEMAFADLAAIMRLAEGLLKAVSDVLLENHADDLAFFAKWVDPECIKRLEGLSRSDFAVIEYTEAIAQLQASKQSFVFPVEWGMDLQTEHERYLTETLLGKPVIVTNYPKDIKAFYMRQNDDGKTVAAMDVLLPGIGEIIGGSQREERYAVLRDRIISLGLDLEAYQWYLDLRRYGSVKHAGFGLGFERLVRYVTGVANIRDIAPFPRAPGLVDP